MAEEVKDAVQLYFEMLELDLQNLPMVKESFYRRFTAKHRARSTGSVGRKMSNISAVLVGLGRPHLRGLPPLSNFQHILVRAVLDYLEQHPQLDRLYYDALMKPPAIQSVDVIHGNKFPKPVSSGLEHVGDEAVVFKRDFLALESRNRELGLAGENLVVRLEQEVLHRAGRKKLAEKVEHVADTKGDGLGYDIQSYEVTGRPKLIEVKTTKYSIDVPFFVSKNEVSVSSECSDLYHLYRLYSYGISKSAGLYRLKGALSSSCILDAVSFRAHPQHGWVMQTAFDKISLG